MWNMIVQSCLGYFSDQKFLTFDFGNWLKNFKYDFQYTTERIISKQKKKTGNTQSNGYFPISEM